MVHGARNQYEVVHDRPGFSRKKHFDSKIVEMEMD